MGLFGRVVGLALTVALVGCDEFSADPGAADATSVDSGAADAAAFDAIAPDAGDGLVFIGARTASAPMGKELIAPLPAGAAVSDVAVAIWVAAFAANTPPPGWDAPVAQSQFGVIPSNDAVLWLGSKVVSDPAAMTTFAMNSAGKQSVTILVFRGARSLQPLVNVSLRSVVVDGGVEAPGFAVQLSSAAALYAFASTSPAAFTGSPPSRVDVVPAQSEVAAYRFPTLLRPGQTAPTVTVRPMVSAGASVAVASFGVAAAAP